MGITHGGGGAIPAEPTAAPQPSPPRHPLRLEVGSQGLPRRWQRQAGRGERVVGGDSSASSGLPGRASATTARKPRYPPAGSRGNAGNGGRTTRGGRARAAENKLNCRPFFSLSPSLWGGHPTAGDAASLVGSSGTSRCLASAAAQGPPFSAPKQKPPRSAQPQNPCWARAAPHPGTEAPKAKAEPSLSD